MCYYIIAAHGQYAQAVADSCEMLTGNGQLYRVVNFDESMSKADLEQQYRQILQTETAQCAGILTDIRGGSPFNAALNVQQDFPDLPIVSGTSLALCVALCSGESLDDALQLAQQNLECHGKFAKNLPDLTACSTPSAPMNAEDNPIIHVRVDERLVHGQVATMWLREAEATRVMVVDDDVVKNEVEKIALQTSVPANVRLSILTVKGASERLQQQLYQGQRVFLLVKTPETLLKMVELGVMLPEVNIGNMSKRNDRRALKKSVYMTEREIAAVKQLQQHGINVTAQMVPSEQKLSIDHYLATE